MLARFVVLALFPAFAVGCGQSSTPAGIATSSNAINGGNIEDDHPNVGLLIQHHSDGSYAQCTGTLATTPDQSARNVVITAKHCEGFDTFYVGSGVATPSDNGDLAAATAAMTAYRVVAEADVDPGSVDDGACPHAAVDVRLLLLDQNVDGITPAVVGTTAPDLGTWCQAVGFGRHLLPDGTTDFLRRRSVSVPLDGETSSSVHQGDVSLGVPGKGDSGGPLFCGDVLSGTVSCGAGPVDNQYDQSYARVDARIGTIESIIGNWMGSNAAAPSEPAVLPPASPSAGAAASPNDGSSTSNGDPGSSGGPSPVDGSAPSGNAGASDVCFTLECANGNRYDECFLDHPSMCSAFSTEVANECPDEGAAQYAAICP